MPMEYTFAMIKPDAVVQDAWLKIMKTYEAAGLAIVDSMIFASMPVALAKELYREHFGKLYYNDLLGFITAGPVVVMMIYGEDAVKAVRNLNGATKPEDWAEGTIRKRFGTDLMQNAVHGSDSTLAAARELEIFFPGPRDLPDAEDPAQ